MFWYPIILMVLVTLEFVSGKIANVGPSKTFPMSCVTDHSGERALRSKSTETKDDERNNFTAEERAAILSHIKVWVWFERGRTNDFVLNKLGLERLSGEALTSHPNYKYFKNFAYKTEGNDLRLKLKSDTSTTALWKELKLGDVEIEKLIQAPAFRTYERYMRIFENKANLNAKNNYNSAELVDWHASPNELLAKAYIWAHYKKSNDYVWSALRLREEDLLTKHPRPEAYRWYLKWSMQLAKDKKAAKDLKKAAKAQRKTS